MPLVLAATSADPAAISALHGWVGPGAVVGGLLLLVIALYRRSRATLARKRDAAQPGDG
ncbi:hypothetical protein GCM10023222_43510 [Saccharopolyspora cebuensis]